MKNKYPFRRDIILVIMLLLLILVAIIFPRFKELREPVQKTEIIYIEQEKNLILDDPMMSTPGSESLLQLMHERPIPPELIQKAIDFEMPVLDTFEWKSFDKFEPKGHAGPPPPSKGSVVIWNSEHPLYNSPPKLIGGEETFNNNLVYPRSELGDKFSTNTLVQIYIEIDSCVHKTHIMKSRGSIILDKIAEDALKQARWIPARLKRPVAAWFAFPVEFKQEKAQDNILIIPDELDIIDLPNFDLEDIYPANSVNVWDALKPIQTSEETPVGIVEYPAPAPIGGIKAIENNMIYPPIKDWSNIQDRVILQAFIDTNGIVTQVMTMKTCGNDTLDKAAEVAVKKTKWKPAIGKDGPVGVWILFPVTFKLNK